MPNFQQMVHDRSKGDPKSFLTRGTNPPDKSPFSPATKRELTELSKVPQVNPQQRATPIQQVDKSQSPNAPKIREQRQATQQPAKGASESAPVNQGRQDQYSETRDKRKAEFQALKEELKRIQVPLVAQRLGGLPNQDNDRSKWKLPNVGNMSITGQKWWNFLAERGGYGAIDFVKHVLNIEFKEAMNWLSDEFADQIDSESIKSASEQRGLRKEDKNFTPPLRSEKHLPAVKHYLKFNRRIPEEIIDELVSRGCIYADEHKNCIFYSDGIAEIRSSFDGPNVVKKLVTGSTRQQGFLVLPSRDINERTLAICEAAIDAMSYRALHPGRSAISSAGANRTFPRAVAEEAVENGFKVIAAFDADKAGDNASQALFNHFYLKLWLKHKFQAELGKEMDDEDIFKILDSSIVTFRLPISGDPSEGTPEHAMLTPEQLLAEKRNLLFFNKLQAFEAEDSPPIILVEIKRNELGLPPCQDFPLEVSQRGFNFVIQTLGVSRDRPRGEKDWNELLKRVGPTAKTTSLSSPAPSSP